MSDFRDYLKRGNAAPETGHGAAAEPSFAAAVRPEPEPAEQSDEVAVPSGRWHNRMVQTLFVYPPDDPFGKFFQYCDMTGPGDIAVDGRSLRLRFRGYNGVWRIAIEGERLAYLAGRIGEHKQGLIQVTKPKEWPDRTRLVKEAVVENIVVSLERDAEAEEEEDGGPGWNDDKEIPRR